MSQSQFGSAFFAQYSRSDLNELLAAINTELKVREARDIAAARDRIHAIAKEVGMPLSELLGKVKPVANKPKVAARYRNPDNHNELWTGRGRQPRWVVAALESGVALNTLMIPEPPQSDRAGGTQ